MFFIEDILLPTVLSRQLQFTIYQRSTDLQRNFHNIANEDDFRYFWGTKAGKWLEIICNAEVAANVKDNFCMGITADSIKKILTMKIFQNKWYILTQSYRTITENNVQRDATWAMKLYSAF